MKRFKAITLLIASIILFSCHQENKKGQSNLIFPKGNKIENKNFTGTAYLEMLVDADSLNPNSVGSVTFEPGARTNWHLHPAGQIIVAIDGEGYYQEKGNEKRIIKKGETIKCPPDTPHWHGATEKSAFVQIAITSREKGETKWLEAVSDEEYQK